MISSRAIGTDRMDASSTHATGGEIISSANNSRDHGGDRWYRAAKMTDDRREQERKANRG